MVHEVPSQRRIGLIEVADGVDDIVPTAQQSDAGPHVTL